MSHEYSIGRCSIAALAGVLALMFASAANASTSIDEHRSASPQGTVEIDNVAGSIDVQGWDKPEVSVTGSIGKDVERVEVTGDSSRTSIRVILPRGGHWGMQDGEAHLVIRVPTNSSLSASMVSSELKIAAVRGALDLRSVSGGITGEGGGDVRANNVSGEIRLVVNAAKRIEVKAISGEIDLTAGNADIEVTTVSGDAKLMLGSVGRARFKSVSGSVNASLAAAPDAQIDAESISGAVKLRFASEPSADFNVQTLSGDIRNCFGPKPVEPRYGPGKRLEFKSGDGGGRVRVTTNSGEVEICTKK